MKRRLPVGRRVCDYVAAKLSGRWPGRECLGHGTRLALGRRHLRAEPLETRRLLTASTMVGGVLMEFETIQAAIDAAESGGTVLVAPGTYEENLTIDKDLTLDGTSGVASDVVIDPDGGDGITFAADVITISDLRVTGADDGIVGDGISAASVVTLSNVEVVGNSWHGIALASVGDVVVVNVVCDGNAADGMTIDTADSLTVTSSSFSNNTSDGIYVSYLGPGGDASLVDVVADGNSATNLSLYLEESASVTITGGSFSNGLYYGIQVAGYGDVFLTDVTADGNNNTNAYIATDGSVIVAGGSFCDSVNDYGLVIVAVGSVEVLNVSATGNYANLSVGGGTTATVSGGSFDGGGFGVRLGTIGEVLLSDLTADANTYASLEASVVESLTIENCSFSNSLREGIVLLEVTTVTLTNVAVNDCESWSLVLALCDDAIVTDSSFSGSAQADGIWIWGADGDVTLTNVTADGNYANNVWVDLGYDMVIDPETGDVTWVPIQTDSVTITGGSFSNSVTGMGIALNGVATANVLGATIDGNATGVYVGPSAAAKISGNSIVGTGASVGIDVCGGTALVEGNNLTGGLVGLLVRPDGEVNAVVDAGQLAGGTDFTGLGVSTGGNDFSGYTTSDATSGAVVNLNADTLAGPQGVPADVAALGNLWYSADPLEIEAAIYHDADDPSGLVGFVNYAVLSDLNIALTEDAGVATVDGSFTNDPQAHQVLIAWGDGTTDLVTLEQGVWAFEAEHVYSGGGGGAPNVDDTTMAVEENSLNGTLVGTVVGTGGGGVSHTITVTVTDVSGGLVEETIETSGGGGGGGPLTYSIVGGTGQTAFAIDAVSGDITVADQTQLDYEAVTSYTLVVQVADGSGATDTAVVTVDLVNRPSVTGAVFVDVNENGLYEANEPTNDDIVVELLDEWGAPVLDGLGNPVTSTTDGGYFLFEDLVAGTYQLRELQPTGVDDGAEVLGSLGGSVTANDTMQLTLATTDAYDYIFGEIGQAVSDGDTASVGFWHSRRGRNLMIQGGTGLAQWLTENFTNIFGDALVGADGLDVYRFFQSELFRHRSIWSLLTAKVDTEFMALALATYFTNHNLAGDVATAYGFNVTDTGIATKIVNVGYSGEAFGVANFTDLTIMQLLQATNSMTDPLDNLSGYANTYDQNGDGRVNASEAWLRILADNVFRRIIRQGD